MGVGQIGTSERRLGVSSVVGISLNYWTPVATLEVMMSYTAWAGMMRSQIGTSERQLASDEVSHLLWESL